jgi:PAS domain S-box-containing protein
MQRQDASSVVSSSAPATSDQGVALATAGGDPFRLLADTAPVMLWRSDATKGCDFFNRSWLEFTGRSLEQERGFGWTDGVHPEDADNRMATYGAAFDARQDYTMHYRLRRHDGAWRWVMDRGRPYEVNGRFAGYVGSCVDITEMKLALDERRQVQQEREALLTELHHRVKNNTQVTTSFLALQAARAEDPLVSKALRAAATRVMLSSLVQDRMFRIAGGAGVDLGPELVATARMAKEIVGRHGIELEERIETTVVVPVAQATPLALIVNELMVNALRHAFPTDREGRIRLVLRRPSPGVGEILVEDDGMGLPEGARRRPPRQCLGLHLIARLSRQARASVKLEPVHPEGHGGTRASVVFPTS